jgi:molybdenum cofactor cytidylyltransferase
MKISGVILAAGKSSRMGEINKLLLKYKKHTIIEEVASQMLLSKLDDVIVVTGHDKETVQEKLKRIENDRLNIIYNKNYQLGRSESIKCAVNHISSDTDAICFMVADKPQINSLLYDRCLYEFKNNKPDLLYVETPSGRGHPIIFSNKLFPALLKLQGDTVGNDLIERYNNNAIVIKDENLQIDIDTVEEYNNLLN